jgi:serine/threonine protein kinase
LGLLVQICLACSTKTTETSGHFCPECGAVMSQLDEDVDPTADTRTGSSRDKAAASLIGTKVDGFLIEGVIGGGSFGTVYRAKQTGLDRTVALKIPTMEIAADPISAKRFAREARAAARIEHPGIVAIYAVGELADSRPYLAMQMLDGVPLDSILEAGPVPLVRALRLVRQIASALSETHAADVVHRDLKPTNIMWRKDRAGDDRITIVDFGIAVCKPGNADATRLTAGGLIGTPHYMSPEQAHGDAVDARADLYALGCLLFELITGTTPFDGSGFEVLLAHLGKPAPRPSDRDPNIPEIVDRLVAKLMAKKPAERVQTADAAIELIDEAIETLEHQLPQPSPGTPKPTRAKRRENRTASTRKELRAAAQAYDDELREAPPHPSPVRWMALGAAGALAVAFAAFMLLRSGGTSASSIDDTEPTQVKRTAILQDRGDLRLRVYVPDPFAAGRGRLHLEIRNKLGAPVTAETIIITVENPDGRALAVTARPRQDNPEQFTFAFDFKTPGTYHLRVFPPEDATGSTTTFDVALNVVAR